MTIPNANANASDAASGISDRMAIVGFNHAAWIQQPLSQDPIALEAANPAYETRIFGPDRVKVQGRLVGLIRRY